jgi:flagellar hook-associated protein 3 FlgL
MRIADKMGYEQVKSNLSKNRQEMLELQNQAATQKKINKPSDDPMAASRVLTQRTEIKANTQFQKDIFQAKSFLETSEQSLGELADIFIRAKELAIAQANDPSANPTSRQVTAAEVGQLLGQTMQVSNRRYGDRYIFGGYKTTQAPFDVHGNYYGDDGEMKVAVARDNEISMNVPGSKIFIGRIGVQAPDTRTPDDHLREDEDSRSLPVGGEYVDEGYGVPLRGPSSDSNAVSRSRPELNEDDINTSSANANSNDGGALRLGGRGGGSGSRSKATDGKGLSSSWSSSGVNVFRVLSDFQTGLMTNDKATIQDSIDRIDEALAQVVLGRSEMGWRVAQLSSSSEGLQKATIQAKTVTSNLEDADTFELVSDINKSQATLKASLETSSKVIQPSLLDFLR